MYSEMSPVISHHTVFTPSVPIDENSDIVNRIKEVKEEFDALYSTFDFVCDQYLVEMYIYKIKALEAEYTHLLKILKKDL